MSVLKKHTKKCCKKFRDGKNPCKKCPLIVHLGKKKAKKLIKATYGPGLKKKKKK